MWHKDEILNKGGIGLMDALLGLFLVSLVVVSGLEVFRMARLGWRRHRHAWMSPFNHHRFVQRWRMDLDQAVFTAMEGRWIRCGDEEAWIFEPPEGYTGKEKRFVWVWRRQETGALHRVLVRRVVSRRPVTIGGLAGDKRQGRWVLVRHSRNGNDDFIRCIQEGNKAAHFQMSDQTALDEHFSAWRREDFSWRIENGDGLRVAQAGLVQEAVLPLTDAMTLRLRTPFGLVRHRWRRWDKGE